RARADRPHLPGALPALARAPRPELRPRATPGRPARHALERERARARRARRQACGARGVPQPARRDERLPAPLPLPQRAVRHRRSVGARADRGGALRRTAMTHHLAALLALAVVAPSPARALCTANTTG